MIRLFTLLLACLCIATPAPAQIGGGPGRFVAQYRAPTVAPPPPASPGLTHWTACAVAAKAGTGSCAILLDAGDSTSAGCCGPTTYAQTKVYKTYQALLSAGLPVIYDWWCGQGNSVGDPSTAGVVIRDARAVMGSGWSLISGNAMICPGAKNTSGSGTFAFTPADGIDTCDIYYAKTAGSGAANVNFDGGATVTTLSTNGTVSTAKATATGTLGAHTLNIVVTSGSVYLTAIDCYPSNGHKIRILHAGVSAAVSGDWTSATGYSAWPMMALIQPALVVPNLGINDWNTGVSSSTYQANMNTVIGNAFAAYSGTDVMLEYPHSTNDGATEGQQAPYGAVLSALASTYGLTLFSPRASMGDWNTVNGNGYAYDSNHYNAAGQAVEAGIEAAPLIATAN